MALRGVGAVWETSPPIVHAEAHRECTHAYIITSGGDVEERFARQGGRESASFLMEKPLNSLISGEIRDPSLSISHDL